jgi:hypothetical protein
LVSGAVSAGVVDRLEPVEIEEHDAQLRTGARLIRVNRLSNRPITSLR